jgi:hypothetical protein
MKHDFVKKFLKFSLPGEIPSKRRAHCSGSVGINMFIFGGGDGQSPLNELYSLNTETLVWKKHSPIKKGKFWPSPRGYHTGTMLLDKFYVLGGSSASNCYSDAVIYDTKTESWSIRTLSETKCR